MDGAQHTQIVSFIWGIADDVLRDVFVRGKYRDVILPMTVIRRLDAVLEPTKQRVLDEKVFLDGLGIKEQDGALRQAAGQSFYNMSNFTLRGLLADPNQLEANFRSFLDGFSPNVQEILDKFEFRNQIPGSSARTRSPCSFKSSRTRGSTSGRGQCSVPTVRSGCRGWTTTRWGRSSRS